MPIEKLPAPTWLSRTLADSGVTHVFFVDAVLRNSLIALREVGVQPVLAHTEKAAAYVADGDARVAGRPGICMAQSVGAANLAAGLQDARLGHSPVIAFTGRKPEAQQHRNAYQEVEHAPFFAAVTKFSARVDKASDLPRLLRRAWRTTLTGSPGPAHLDLAGLQAEDVEAGEIAGETTSAIFHAHVPAHRPVAGADEIARAAKAMTSARRPVLVVGAGAVASGAAAEIQRLAHLLHAPIATTLGGRGIIATRHPLAIGTIGTYGIPPTNEIVSGADLTIVIGSQLSDQSTCAWHVPAPPVLIVQIDTDPLEIGHSYVNTLAVVGDPKSSVDAIIARLSSGPTTPRSAEYAEEAARKITEWRTHVATALRSDTAPIAIERLCAEMTNALPVDAILVADTGYSGIWTCTLVELNGAGQKYLRAAGSLGWAFPAALGAKCAAPDRKVVCFTGDGGFCYHLAELETARRRGIAVTVVVNNNSGFGQGMVNMRRQGKTLEQVRDLVCFENTDFAAVARSFGLDGIRVENPAELAPALQRAVASDRTTVVDVVTSIAQTPPKAAG